MAGASPSWPGARELRCNRHQRRDGGGRGDGHVIHQAEASGESAVTYSLRSQDLGRRSWAWLSTPEQEPRAGRSTRHEWMPFGRQSARAHFAEAGGSGKTACQTAPTPQVTAPRRPSSVQTATCSPSHRGKQLTTRPDSAGSAAPRTRCRGQLTQQWLATFQQWASWHSIMPLPAPGAFSSFPIIRPQRPQHVSGDSEARHGPGALGGGASREDEARLKRSVRAQQAISGSSSAQHTVPLLGTDCQCPPSPRCLFGRTATSFGPSPLPNAGNGRVTQEHSAHSSAWLSQPR